MAEGKKTQLADLQKQVAAKLDRVRVTEFSDAPKYQALANAINTLAVDSYIGNVAFIGRDSSGGYNVQFKHRQHRLFVFLAGMGVRDGQDVLDNRQATLGHRKRGPVRI